MGAYVGAVYASEAGLHGTHFRESALRFFQALGPPTGIAFLTDLTYPAIGATTGQAMNKFLQLTFGDACIEDLWVPFFCVSTDLTAAGARVHTSGRLWRYVRASMGILEMLPPICDPLDGHHLVDGAYTNNVPVNIMRSHFDPRSVLAVDVGASHRSAPSPHGDTLSGWRVLLNRFNPWGHAGLPTAAAIQDTLIFICSNTALESMKATEKFCHIRVDTGFEAHQFEKCEQIEAAGLAACSAMQLRSLAAGTSRSARRGTIRATRIFGPRPDGNGRRSTWVNGD